MIKKNELLSKHQSRELQKLIDEMTEEAKKVVDDYKENPSSMSGSITQVHENSPYLASREERVVSIDGKNFKIKPDKQ